MKNDKSESNGTANQGRAAGMVIDDIWSTFPNVHLRVLTAENESVEIQICDCGMSGQCRPQGWARIEKHNRQRLASAIAAATPSPETAVGGEARQIAEQIVRDAGQHRRTSKLIADIESAIIGRQINSERERLGCDPVAHAENMQWLKEREAERARQEPKPDPSALIRPAPVTAAGDDEGEERAVCDCHTWPTVAEMHDYVEALERIVRGTRPEHKCKPIARAVMDTGRDWWVGELLEPVPEWPKETHCLHMKTPVKDLWFLCNSGDFEQLMVIGNSVVQLANLEWLKSMTEGAGIRAAALRSGNES